MADETWLDSGGRNGRGKGYFIFDGKGQWLDVDVGHRILADHNDQTWQARAEAAEMSRFIDTAHTTDKETGDCPFCYSKGYEAAEHALEAQLASVTAERDALYAEAKALAAALEDALKVGEQADGALSGGTLDTREDWRGDWYAAVLAAAAALTAWHEAYPEPSTPQTARGGA